MRNDLKLRNIFEIQPLTSKITNVLLKLECNKSFYFRISNERTKTPIPFRLKQFSG